MVKVDKDYSIAIIKSMREQDKGPVKALAVLGFVACGALAVQTFRSYQDTQTPETATADTLQGPGYSIQRSTLGENILEIRGANIFPFQNPTQSIARGRERLERTCGPLLGFGEVFQAVPTSNGFATVSNASNCFPRT